MRSLSLFIAFVCVCGFLIAARLMAIVQSPPAAYLALALGAASVVLFCVALAILWLVAA